MEALIVNAGAVAYIRFQGTPQSLTTNGTNPDMTFHIQVTFTLRWLLAQSHINSPLTKGVGGYHPPPHDNFSLLPPNQQESYQSHLGNLNYILCVYFDVKKKLNKQNVLALCGVR